MEIGTRYSFNRSEKEVKMWTRFMDMHSGGGMKEPPYEYIFIEAPGCDKGYDTL